MPELRAPDESLLLDAVLHRVIDGDSIEVFIDGRVQILELSAVDAPEIREGLTPQRGADEASAMLGLLTRGEALRVLVDPRRAKDAAGRMRGYVYRAPELTLINLELVRLGLAKHPRTPAGWNERVFEWAQAQARGARKGLWDPSFGFVEEPTPVLPEVIQGAESSGMTALDQPDSNVTDGAQPEEVEEATTSIADSEPVRSGVVYVTKSGSKYHTKGCQHVSQSGRAVARGDLDPLLEACKVCKPDSDQ